MAILKSSHNFLGINRDVGKDKYNPNYYYDASCINIVASADGEMGAVTNTKGNEFALSIDSIDSITAGTITYTVTIGSTQSQKTLSYTSPNTELEGLTLGNDTHKIIGDVLTNDSIILFTTNDLGVDCIFEVTNTGSWDINLLYINDLGFNSNYTIRGIFNFENELIQKVYFTDYNTQVKHFNKVDSTLIDIEASLINIKGNVDLVTPKITNKFSGGTHTSGMIQYAYSLYNLNGASTGISPLSTLTPLSQYINNGGGEVNQVVGQTNEVTITGVDTRYDSIKIYAIKYTSLNVDPVISLIADDSIDSSSKVITDDGRIINTISSEEFLFLGGNPIIANDLTAKNNRLFIGNIKELNFDVNFDARAYSFIDSGTGFNWRLYYKDSSGNTSYDVTFVNETDLQNYIATIPSTEDLIVPDYSVARYNYSTSYIGGKGTNVEYSIVPKTAANLSDSAENLTFFKSGEKYRLAIEFKNKLGQKSLPKWIGDFKAPNGYNLYDNYLTLQVKLTASAISYLQSQGIVGWQVIRANRELQDRTIMCQGVVNPMVFQEKTNIITDPTAITATDKQTYFDRDVKYPSPFMRYVEDYTESTGSGYYLTIKGYSDKENISTIRQNTSDDAPYCEFYVDRSASDRNQWTFMSTQLFNFYSPEIYFMPQTFGSGLKYRPVGSVVNTQNQSWGKKIRNDYQELIEDHTNTSGLSLYLISNKHLHELGMIGQGGDLESMNFYQYYRKFEYNSANLLKPTAPEYPIKGKPSLIEEGVGRQIYDNDGTYAFGNTLNFLTADKNTQDSNSDLLLGVNSYGTRSLAMVTETETTLENICSAIGITSGAMTIDIVRDLTNQYGGASYEARKRTNYITVGDYNDITTSSVDIDNAGDIYVQVFRFERISPTNIEVHNYNYLQMVEIVELPVETSIDLKNRNDYSLNNWNDAFQPKSTDYHKYNQVYSQMPTLITSRDLAYNFQEVSDFPNLIRASKVKTPGEYIDSWTDFLTNEELAVDGSYGAITRLVNNNDNVFAYQPKGVSYISINPRVQTVGSDGLSVELGTGQVLARYQYISTLTGCSHKNGIVNTGSSVYHYDSINNGIFKIAGTNLEGISDSKAIHKLLTEKVNTVDLKQDNIVNGNGVLLGYDRLNNDIYFSFKQTNPFTIKFNEASNSFVTEFPYNPSRYLYYDDKFLAIGDGLDSELWQQNIGNYGSFFGTIYPSYITLLVNPQTNDNIFNNIKFKTEAFDSSGNDLPKVTLDSIQAYNDYQDTGTKALTLNSNLSRYFRNWSANIPRDATHKLDRIRSPWVFVKLNIDNTNNNKIVLHSIDVDYTTFG
jgi:hypothetical protein